MPVLAGAGLMVRVTVLPVCKPTPQQLTARLTVYWFGSSRDAMVILYIVKKIVFSLKF
jgi:hypothetical protein